MKVTRLVRKYYDDYNVYNRAADKVVGSLCSTIVNRIFFRQLKGRNQFEMTISDRRLNQFSYLIYLRKKSWDGYNWGPTSSCGGMLYVHLPLEVSRMVTREPSRFWLTVKAS